MGRQLNARHFRTILKGNEDIRHACMWWHVRSPGRMELTRTPFGANSNARSCVSLSWAAFAAPYADMGLCPGITEITEEMLTTAPCKSLCTRCTCFNIHQAQCNTIHRHGLQNACQMLPVQVELLWLVLVISLSADIPVGALP